MHTLAAEQIPQERTYPLRNLDQTAPLRREHLESEFQFMQMALNSAALRKLFIWDSENLWQITSLINLPLSDKKCSLEPLLPLFIYFDTRNVILHLRL